MNEERRMILEMLKNGSVTVEEAQRLMEALPRDGAESEPAALSVNGAPILTPKRLVVLVTENGKNKVNIRIPFSLIRAGLKLGQSFSSLGAKYIKDDQEGKEALEILKNIDIDELLASISDGEITLPYTMIDIDGEENGQQQHVQIVLQ